MQILTAISETINSCCVKYSGWLSKLQSIDMLLRRIGGGVGWGKLRGNIKR